VSYASVESYPQLDIRVGRIFDVDDFQEAQKSLYKLTTDIGKSGIKKPGAGFKYLYAKQDLIKLVVVIVPKQISNLMSECLVFAISNSTHTSLLQPDKEPGTQNF